MMYNNFRYFTLVLLLVLLAACPGSDKATSIPSNNNDGSPKTDTFSSGTLSAIWANTGEDKVTKDELRATQSGTASVQNSVWDGSTVSLFGAKNEVVSFQLLLESAAKTSNNVEVHFNTLNGPSGFQIHSKSASGNDVFKWNDRNIELFYVRYLQIKGLSRISYETYDERHIPARFRRPYDSSGVGSGTWNDRPDHNKYYPEIAVPLELMANKFNIPANTNQGIVVDIYIPKTAPAGTYTGTVTIAQSGSTIRNVPVNLEVKTFTLPDMPKAKTMVVLGYGDVAKRYTGTESPASGSSQDVKLKKIRDIHFQMAHRHKISLIDADPGSTPAPNDRPRDEWLPRLNGSLFNAAHDYDGPGVNTGNNVYSIGTYGSWTWKSAGEPGMHSHSDAWVQWFQNNSPNTEYFLYLIDEPPATEYPQVEQWAEWIANNPGVGKALPSFATLSLTHALEHTPTTSIVASWFSVGDTSEWTNAYISAKAETPPKKIYMYNGKRPSNGSFATEDDGIALRELAWAQYKKGIDRWFFWESTYYKDFQGGRGETNVFQTAQTFGAAPTPSESLGESNWNYSNGDGVLFYPGTDKVFPSESYDVNGPFASLRLKYWRRGIQDVDYISLAHAVNPTLTETIVEQIVPKALWDYGISDPSDPTWVRSDISWSTDPDVWEKARKNLANIIEGKPVELASAQIKTKNPQSETSQSTSSRLMSLARSYASAIKKK